MTKLVLLRHYSGGEAARRHASRSRSPHGGQMRTEERTYRSYLLRLWQVEQNGDWVWRCSLEEAGSGRHQKFVDLDALFGYLRAETGAAPVAQKEDEK